MRIITVERNLQEVDLGSYDAVMLRGQNQYTLARYALEQNKHVCLVAPLHVSCQQLAELERIKNLLHVIYPYDFMPQCIALKQYLKTVGSIKHCRILFAAVADEHSNGALLDLGPHVLHLLYVLFGDVVMQHNFNIVHKDQFGRQVIFADMHNKCSIEVEVNLLAARNCMSFEIYGAHDNVLHQFTIDDAMQAALMQNVEQEFKVSCESLSSNLQATKWIVAELEHLVQEDVLLA